MNPYLVRDESGEPVMKLVERDRYGRFITPYYGYIWRDDPQYGHLHFRGPGTSTADRETI